MLTETKLHQILARLPHLTIAVVGDFFLDKYLDLDSRLTEKSVETGLGAYQVTGVRTSPGAGGTVTNNLASLGVGRIWALTLIGVDGEGFELKRELAGRGVDLAHVIETPDRQTPTYTKPMLSDGSAPARELNRLDIKNRTPIPAMLVRELARRLDQVVAQADAVIVSDQVSEPECGVMTLAMRERLAELGQRFPSKIIVADSRQRIGLFRNVITKPNRTECLGAVGAAEIEARSSDETSVAFGARQLAARTGRPVYCTLGEVGMLYADASRTVDVPAYPVRGPIDMVGAGDSATAGIVCALCCGVDPIEAAAMGSLVASITIQQLGKTGTATPEQVIARWRELQATAG
ncbi:MAG: carbohydrate kinase [Planctomycetes bacterium]|nr:carbohydrate kinase [Planctomycetota bacterium]